MGRLTRDRTAEPVSRDQILSRHVRRQGNIHFPVQLTTSRIDNLTRLIHTLLHVMTMHTFAHVCKNSIIISEAARSFCYVLLLSHFLPYSAICDDHTFLPTKGPPLDYLLLIGYQVLYCPVITAPTATLV